MVLVFLAMYGLFFLITQYLQLVRGYSALGAATRLMPTALLMIVVAPQTPRISARIGANRTVAIGMGLSALGMFSFLWLDATTSYVQMIGGFCLFMVGISLTMSPMTASIMSAVPARRAGAGSSMNDATRELGAALGVAVLGSITATHYAHAIAPTAARALPADAAGAATGSLADALGAADTLPEAARATFTAAARHAFLDGVHVSVVIASALAATTALVVLRYLPRTVRHQDLAEIVDVAPAVEEEPEYAAVRQAV
jgi:Na+/melibiose symporter-like transporter